MATPSPKRQPSALPRPAGPGLRPLARAARIAGGRLHAVAAEVKVRARGARVFIDVDVEGTP